MPVSTRGCGQREIEKLPAEGDLRRRTMTGAPVTVEQAMHPAQPEKLPLVKDAPL